MRLEGIDRITVPFLITHGAKDRQILVACTHATHEQAVNSPDLELRVLDDAEGGTEHISLDNLPVVGAWIADGIGGGFA